MVANPEFAAQRVAALAGLDLATLDTPIKELIAGLSQAPHCFTMQSCWGHFVLTDHVDDQDFDPPQHLDSAVHVDYRIAYVALCIDNNPTGAALLDDLQGLVSLDPAYVQFGSAEWFWQQQVNTYQVQVEPERHQYKDRVQVAMDEARHLARVRDRLYKELAAIAAKNQAS